MSHSIEFWRREVDGLLEELAADPHWEDVEGLLEQLDLAKRGLKRAQQRELGMYPPSEEANPSLVVTGFDKPDPQTEGDSNDPSIWDDDPLSSEGPSIKSNPYGVDSIPPTVEIPHWEDTTPPEPPYHEQNDMTPWGRGGTY